MDGVAALFPQGTFAAPLSPEAHMSASYQVSAFGSGSKPRSAIRARPTSPSTVQW